MCPSSRACGRLLHPRRLVETKSKIPPRMRDRDDSVATFFHEPAKGQGEAYSNGKRQRQEGGEVDVGGRGMGWRFCIHTEPMLESRRFPEVAVDSDISINVRELGQPVENATSFP